MIGRDGDELPCAHDPDLGGDDGEAVQGAFGAGFLDDADEGVGHEHDAEQRVAELPGG